MGVYGPLAISLMFFVQAILPLVPYAILAGVAGIIFGKWLGIFIAWIGALAGTLSIYLLARYTGTGFFQPWLKRKYEIARELGVDQIVASQGWGAVTSRDCGNMVSKAIQLAEKSLTKV